MRGSVGEQRLLTFGPFRLDAADERLWHNDEVVPLTAKAFAVLRYLLEHAGRLVTREALCAAVWGTAYVSDAALASCIRDIRRALDDSAPWLETVRGRGYRFLAPVTVTSQSPAQAVTRLPPPPVLQLPGLVVGREAELRQLHQCLAAALRGERRVVLVTGEAGIGKTTLIDAFVGQVASAADVWLGRGQCIEQYGAGEPYLPLLEALGQLGRVPDRALLVALLRQHAPSWLLHLPALVPATEFDARQQPSSGATRERMLRELAEAIEVLSSERPLLLVLEDLHWSDAATIDWLSYMARRRVAARLLVLGTYRPVEAVVRAHPVRTMVQELQVRGQCTELVLEYLSAAAVAAYLVQRGGGGPLPAGLARILHQRTNGNPLFLATMVEALRRQGALRESAAGWELPGGLQAIAVVLPDDLRQLVEQQVEQLPPADQILLEAASVVGTEFAVASVAAAVESQIDDVESRCTTLARRGQFIRACGMDAWPDGTVATRYGFLHDLYRETVYNRLPAGQRVRWHRQIGTRLEQGYGVQAREVAAELAMHFLQGLIPQRAVQYLHAAGETALRRSAPQEAITSLTQGLTLLQQWPDTHQRAQQELHLQIVLGTALMVTKGWGHADVGHTYARARALCEQVGDTERLFPVLAGLWEYANGSAQHTLARDLGEHLLAVAQERHDPALLLQAHQALWTTALNTGGFTTAHRHLEYGLALCTAEPHQGQTDVTGGHDPRPSVRSYASLILWYLGYPDQAVQWQETALVLARELAHPFTLGHTLVFAAWLQHFCRNAQATSAYAQATLTLGTEQGSQYLVAVSTALLGWALAAQGQDTPGLTYLRRGIAAWEAIGTPHHRPWFLACLAEVCGRCGRVEEALTALAEALHIVEATGGRKDEATLYRLQGELLWQAGNRQEEAAACLHKALAIARDQQAKLLELRAAMALSRLWQGQGKREAARDLLAPIYGWFTEGFATTDLQEASALLATLA